MNFAEIISVGGALSAAANAFPNPAGSYPAAAGWDHVRGGAFLGEWGAMTDNTGDGFVRLARSERRALPNAKDEGPVEGSERIEVTLVTRRRAALPREYVDGPATMTREDLAERHGADPADLSLRRATSPNPTGGAPVTHRYRVGGLQLPAELDGIVTAVIGFDDRPQVRPHLQPAATSSVGTSYTPVQVGTFYGFPSGTDGTGQALAITEFGGGFVQTDLNTYFSGLGITAPSITAVGVDSATNNPGTDHKADSEVMLDVEVAGALAPNATLVVYFAPNTAQGQIDAFSTAVHANPTPTAISTSWGASEDRWPGQTTDAMDEIFSDAAALGITVCAATGDNGATDGVADGALHCDFPASEPYVLACGGTSLLGDTSTGAITSERVWNDSMGATGGGISDVYAIPDYQTNAGVPVGLFGASRGIPDVAGNADPATGYQTRVNGVPTVMGGTSAVAPLWAALVCRLAQGVGKRFGTLQVNLYAGISPGATTAGFRDIISGHNNGYSAAAGWDACTGLGSPNGAALLTRLTS